MLDCLIHLVHFLFSFFLFLFFLTIEDSVVKVSLTLCYGLNAYVPPHSCVEALPHPPASHNNVTVFGDESCVEVIKVK